MIKKSVFTVGVPTGNSSGSFKNSVVTEYRIFSMLLYSTSVEEYVWKRLLPSA